MSQMLFIKKTHNQIIYKQKIKIRNHRLHILSFLQIFSFSSFGFGNSKMDNSSMNDTVNQKTISQNDDFVQENLVLTNMSKTNSVAENDVLDTTINSNDSSSLRRTQRKGKPSAKVREQELSIKKLKKIPGNQLKKSEAGINKGRVSSKTSKQHTAPKYVLPTSDVVETGEGEFVRAPSTPPKATTR